MSSLPDVSIGHARQAWIDTLKALAIFFVFFGHLIANNHIEAFIYAFHLPLFFWISGYLFSSERYPSFIEFVIRRSRSLLVPYFVFAFFSFFFWLFVVRSLSVRGQVYSINPVDPFLGIFYGIGVDKWHHPMDLALWFLLCLFVTECLFWIIKKYFHGRLISSAIILCGLLGYLTAIFWKFRLPWSADVSLTAIVFYGIGNLSIKPLEKYLSWKWRSKLLLIVPAFAILLVGSLLNGKIDMNHNLYGNPVLFYCTALCGTLFWLSIAHIIPQTKLITYLGRNTIVLLGFGGLSSFVINGLFYLAFHSFPCANKFDLLDSILFSIAEILFILPVIFIVNRYFPFILRKVK